MNLDEIYLKAADVIRINGHYKGAYYEPSPESGVGIVPAPAECAVCAAGALSIVVFGDPCPPSVGEEGRAEFDAIVARLFPRIQGFHLYGFEGELPVPRLAGWNDDGDRTPADVIDLFERTAREVA